MLPFDTPILPGGGKLRDGAVPRAEAYFRALIENSLEVILVLGRDGTILEGSPAIERVLGHPAADCVVRSVFDLIHPDDLPRARRALSRSAAKPGRGNIPGEFRVRHRDGTWRIMQVAVNNRLEDPAVAALIVNGREVTEQRRTQDADARLAAIVESTKDAIISSTLEGVVTSWNRGAEMLYAYPAGEAIGRDVGMIVPEDRAAELAQVLEKARRGESVDLETVRLRKGGERLDVSLTICPVRNGGGRIAGISAIAQDITERKRTERTMQKLLRAVECAENAIFMTEPDGTSMFVNPAVGKIFGFPPAESLGKTPRILKSGQYESRF